MTEEQNKKRIQDNWMCVVEEVKDATRMAGRSPDSVTVIGVSKYVDEKTTQALFDAGCTQLGESRPQSLWQKADALGQPAAIRWHMIGHLQRNKVRRLLRFQPLIHSIDSERILHAIAEEATNQSQQIDVLLEVNISGDDAKTGFSPTQLPRVFESLPLSGVVVKGLMAMAGWKTKPDEAKRHFEQTRELRDELLQSSCQALPELSMGMSGDFREAIASGATMVRIGSRLFDGVINRA